jgi:hypothetical protein
VTKAVTSSNWFSVLNIQSPGGDRVPDRLGLLRDQEEGLEPVHEVEGLGSPVLHWLHCRGARGFAAEVSVEVEVEAEVEVEKHANEVEFTVAGSQFGGAGRCVNFVGFRRIMREFTGFVDT